MRCRAADRIDVTAPLAPSPAALAVPDKGCGLAVPGPGGLLEPSADLGGRLGILACQGPALEDALDGLRHVQPTAAERRIERHDAVLAKPHHHFCALMTGEIVPHEQQAQRGNCSGKVKGAVSPPCHTCHAAWVTATSAGSLGIGSLARIAVNSFLSQPCRTELVQEVTGCRYTCPVAGWNRVRILIVPPRTYSCGCVAGWPCGRQLLPGCGTAWNGPASSSHHTARPRPEPSV